MQCTLPFRQLHCNFRAETPSDDSPISGGMDVKLFSPDPRYCKFFSNLERKEKLLYRVLQNNKPYQLIPVLVTVT